MGYIQLGQGRKERNLDYTRLMGAMEDQNVLLSVRVTAVRVEP